MKKVVSQWEKKVKKCYYKTLEILAKIQLLFISFKINYN